MTLPVTGYADRWSVRPGETIRFHIATDRPRPYRARLARIFCGDPNPAGPGYREIAVPSAIDGTHAGEPRPIELGSWIEVPRVLLPGGALEIRVDGLPTVAEDCTLIAIGGEVPVALGLANGAACAAVGDVRLACDAALTLHRWHRLELSVAADGTARLMQSPHRPRLDHPRETALVSAGGAKVPSGPAGVAIGRGFTGKLESPTLTAGSAIVAQWDFAHGIGTDQVRDTGPQAAHGILHNLPMRGMTGTSWDGSVHDWRQDRSHYRAIKFHRTDIGDCRWPESLALTIPDDWESGVYALHLETEDGGCDNIAFAVRARDPGKRARVALLLPTFTYQIYGNFAKPDRAEQIARRAADWGALTHAPTGHPEYGFSTYNNHPDGQGIAMASMRRPMIDKRVNQFQLAGEEWHGSGTYWLAADSYILDLLDRKGIAVEVLTDHDLHAEGSGALAPYACVITGQHPEYHSVETWDAISGYIDGGGRLMYLGGNGFYWKVVPHPDGPWALEVRRAENGIRAWAAEVGEYHHQFDGTLGGLWRRVGRTPQSLVGVGFSAQGHYRGYPYTWLPAIHDPRVAFMREGLAAVPGQKFGERGLMGGGAAGHELDRADVRLGTPHHALVVAKGVVTDPDFQPVNEERLGHEWPGTHEELIRSDITFFEAPRGGAVFSVGSMDFIGAMPIDGYSNACAKLVENVVRRFSDPAPFAVPRSSF
jgi:N,N-dimethylformamidase